MHCTHACIYFLSITEENCTVEGQVYLQQAPPQEYHPTCTNPMKHCNTKVTRPGCVCPEGTVIDESQNRCVPLSNCSKEHNYQICQNFLHQTFPLHPHDCR